MIIENLPNLTIHKFKTQEQYDRALAEGKIDDSAICLTPDIGSMASENPSGTGSFSLNRKPDSPIGANSVATGTDTIAGGKCFIVTSASESAKSFTLDSTEGLAQGDFVSCRVEYNFDKFATITSIDGNTIYVSDTLPSSYYAKIGAEGEDTPFIWIPGKPELGTIAIDMVLEDDYPLSAHTQGINTIAQNIGAHAEGINTVASGRYSHAEGVTTFAAYGSHAEGKLSEALGDQSHAEGYGTITKGTSAHAEGARSEANGEASHAEGRQAKATGDNSHAEGELTVANGYTSHAEGRNTEASGKVAHAEGSGTIASGENAHAEGLETQSTGNASHAEGRNTKASGWRSHTEGDATEATAGNAHAEGGSTHATANNAHAEGNGTTAEGENSHAEGLTTTATGNATHAEGRNTKAIGWRSHAEGDGSTANGANSHAEGESTTTGANAKGAHTEGGSTKVEAEYGHSEGYKTSVTGKRGHAEGNETVASGEDSHAEGYKANSTNNYSHAEGSETTASGNSSHVEGRKNTASGTASHAEGQGNTASGWASHAEGGMDGGDNKPTLASGASSHAEGTMTEATAQSAHAEGHYSKAYGNYSHAGGQGSRANKVGSFAHGQNVIADADHQAVFGTFNKVNANAAFIVGNGWSQVDNTKSNAFEVNKDGNVYVQKGLYVGGTADKQNTAVKVATVNDIDRTIPKRIENIENIISNTVVDFVEDNEVAYIKEVPENVAPYAALNKLGGISYRSTNLIPSYSTEWGVEVDGIIPTTDDEGSIILNGTSTTPANSFIPICLGLTLAKGTYTLSGYPVGSSLASFSIFNASGTNDYNTLGAILTYSSESSQTFTLDTKTTVNIYIEFNDETGTVTNLSFKPMLNIGTAALPWEPYFTEFHNPKVTSIHVTGTNLLDYGEPRQIEVDKNPKYFLAEILSDGNMLLQGFYGEDIQEVGGSVDSPEFPLNSIGVLPAGTYSGPQFVEWLSYDNSRVRFVLHLNAYTPDGSTFLKSIDEHGCVISEEFIIKSAFIRAHLFEHEGRGFQGLLGGEDIRIPLMLNRGSDSRPLVTTVSETIQIPEAIVNRPDYGVGVQDSSTWYSNYIDFENKTYVKACKIIEMDSYQIDIEPFNNGYTHFKTILANTLTCSHNLKVSVEDTLNFRITITLSSNEMTTAELNNYIASQKAAGTPVTVLYGTPEPEVIDISDVLHVDNYIISQPGGLIIFENSDKLPVASSIEYQNLSK